MLSVLYTRLSSHPFSTACTMTYLFECCDFFLVFHLKQNSCSTFFQQTYSNTCILSEYSSLISLAAVITLIQAMQSIVPILEITSRSEGL